MSPQPPERRVWSHVAHPFRGEAVRPPRPGSPSANYALVAMAKGIAFRSPSSLLRSAHFFGLGIGQSTLIRTP